MPPCYKHVAPLGLKADASTCRLSINMSPCYKHVAPLGLKADAPASSFPVRGYKHVAHGVGLKTEKNLKPPRHPQRSLFKHNCRRSTPETCFFDPNPEIRRYL